MDQNLQNRLEEVALIAVRLEKETGCPALEIVAQWAVESQWGSKPAGAHNYFGIKRASRHKKWVTVTTREVVGGKSIICHLEFADYDSLEDSCKDFAWLITNGSPYREAWQAYQKDKSVHNLVFGVARVYATDPRYAQLVCQIAGQSNVCAAVAKVHVDAR